MKYYNYKLFQFICLICLCFLTACSAKSNLVGKWQSTDTDVNIEFFPDNTLQYNGGGEANGLYGKWNIIDDGRVKIEITGPFGGKGVVIGVLKGKHLLLSIDGNNKFTKINRGDDLTRSKAKKILEEKTFYIYQVLKDGNYRPKEDASKLQDLQALRDAGYITYTKKEIPWGNITIDDVAPTEKLKPFLIGSSKSVISIIIAKCNIKVTSIRKENQNSCVVEYSCKPIPNKIGETGKKMNVNQVSNESRRFIYDDVWQLEPKKTHG